MIYITFYIITTRFFGNLAREGDTFNINCLIGYLPFVFGGGS